MTKQLTHVIITRYNVGLYSGGYLWSPKQPRAKWMHHRAELFHRYCVPSIRAQQQQDFRWLVLFDAATPKDELAVTEGVPCEILLTGADIIATILAWIKQHVQTPWLVTTRLDNDDALHVSFVHELQQAVQECVEVLCFPTGWLMKEDYVGRVVWSSNPFSSLVEQTECAVSVCYGPHPKLKQTYKYRELQGDRWLRVIHEDNLGGGLERASTQVAKKTLRQGFPFLFGE